jgi:hypothetical protein
LMPPHLIASRNEYYTLSDLIMHLLQLIVPLV